MALDLALMRIQRAHDGQWFFYSFWERSPCSPAPASAMNPPQTCAGWTPTLAGSFSGVYDASSPQFQPAHCQSYANFEELCKPLPTSRPAYLDAVSGILASHFHAIQNISPKPEALKQYHSVFVTVLNFVIDELNDKYMQ
jgi:hypothetical protein